MPIVSPYIIICHFSITGICTNIHRLLSIFVLNVDNDIISILSTETPQTHKAKFKMILILNEFISISIAQFQKQKEIQFREQFSTTSIQSVH